MFLSFLPHKKSTVVVSLILFYFPPLKERFPFSTREALFIKCVVLTKKSVGGHKIKTYCCHRHEALAKLN